MKSPNLANNIKELIKFNELEMERLCMRDLEGTHRYLKDSIRLIDANKDISGYATGANLDDIKKKLIAIERQLDKLNASALNILSQFYSLSQEVL